ncbi:ABC transporter ATP-binding protein [Dethiothermospora halolimnae]|uniref:ABC transporter ATP-binding protein n=1 Tax=Dethiothermospora halolimnae TaxID=3114390 RepID=UPI003CCC4502
MDNIVTLKNINKYYGKQVKNQVLYDLNLDIKYNSFNSIIGSSGSGKSTLLNIIGTLDNPNSGDVYIDGIKTNTMGKNKLAELRNKTIGFIFQFHHLLPEFTVLENVLMPHLIKDTKPSKEVTKRANHLLDLVGLSEVKNNKSTELSGGQQQRTAIARALINKPKLVLADEPTGNLDSVTSEKVYDLLKKVQKDFETTFIIITHDKKIAERTDRIIEIKDGKIK